MEAWERGVAGGPREGGPGELGVAGGPRGPGELGAAGGPRGPEELGVAGGPRGPGELGAAGAPREGPGVARGPGEENLVHYLVLVPSSASSVPPFWREISVALCTLNPRACTDSGVYTYHG